ncbi:MAG TPA: chromophore lyase CpcT/CpeT [Steroidobacteraceae bacterium]|jgi:hypothetical protein
MTRRTIEMMAALLALALTGCASEMKKGKADLALIDEWLPGRYDNTEQAQQDAQSGRDIHLGLALSIVPIDVPLFSEHTYYVQESAVDDPRRVTSQRLITLEVVKGGRIVQSFWSLAEPARWRAAAENPALFQSMMFRDATRLSGCELEWKKEGTQFVGSNQVTACRVNSPALGSVRMQIRAELSADSLSLAELAYSGEKLVQGNAAEPFYHYRKRSNP